MTTINHVARRAGVAPVTVSRVLNREPNVSAATRERVTQAIVELGYVPNVAARSLRSHRTRSLALIVPDITNTFWTTVARGVEDAAQARGYTVLLGNSDENPQKENGYLELVASQRVDGVIMAPYDLNAERLSILRDREMPTVIVDRKLQGWDVDTVLGDSVGGAYALVSHLVRLGHRRIAALSGPTNTSTAQDRVAGYRYALAQAGIPEDPGLILHGQFKAPSGKELMQQVLEHRPAPSAVFAANNALAMGAIDALAERGLRIPGDMALVCFDDFANASHMFPFLTVAVQPAYDMGLKAAQLLLDRLETGEGRAPQRILLPCTLIIRYSCGSQVGNGHAGGVALPPRQPFQEQRVPLEAWAS